MNTLSPRDLLELRGKDDSVRGQRRDPFHLALVLEGGGMRGVVSVGMAAGFEARGLLRAFDSIHGSSSGACGGAYFVAGQAAYGATIYFENINNRRFINIGRPLAGRPIMDKDFLIDHVMRVEKPLLYSTIAGNPGLLNVVTTEVGSGGSRIFSHFSTESQFFDVLRATICLPGIAGAAVKINGSYFLDGGLVQPLAVRSALEVRATHIIILMTRRSHELRRETNLSRLDLEPLLIKLLYNDRLVLRYLERNQCVNQILDDIEAGHIDDHVRIEAIARAPDSTRIGRLTTNGELLKRARIEAEAAVNRYLDRIPSG